MKKAYINEFLELFYTRVFSMRGANDYVGTPGWKSLCGRPASNEKINHRLHQRKTLITCN
jgi:hypothetical protein